MCGILAHRLGASSVLLTDGDTDTLMNLRTNVSKNCCNEALPDVGSEGTRRTTPIQCRQLVWGNATQIDLMKLKFDTILGSDIIYVEDILDPLWETVSRLLVPNTGRFLLSYARRNVSIDLVLATATKYGFEWETPLVAEGVFIFRSC